MGIRCLVADWSSEDPEVGKLLNQLQGSQQIPFLVIFPAGAPEKAIRLSTYTSAKLLGAIEDAGPSKSADSKGNVASEEKPTIKMSSLPLP